MFWQVSENRTWLFLLYCDYLLKGQLPIKVPESEGTIQIGQSGHWKSSARAKPQSRAPKIKLTGIGIALSLIG